VVEGAEGGGFKNPEEVSTLVLLQAIRERVDLPLVAAGGIVDGRGMAAAFALGAEAIQMGTRFVASAESPVHAHYKQAIVDAAATGTWVLNKKATPCIRALKTDYTAAHARQRAARADAFKGIRQRVLRRRHERRAGAGRAVGRADPRRQAGAGDHRRDRGRVLCDHQRTRARPWHEAARSASSTPSFMHYVGFAELAAAVSNAGGLGIITGLTQRTPELLAAEIKRCRAMTDKPFGVNLTFLPTVSSPDYPGYIKAIIDGGIKAVETAGNNPQKWLPALHEAGVKVIHKCTSVRHSLKAQAIGCDAVSVDGFECGGHPGEDDVPNFILLPRAADELKIPFVASGGMADGRSLVAALALGAEGINMGTRFIATQEAPVHDNVKAAIVAASELDTRLVMRPLRNTERVLRNAAVDRLLEKERSLGANLKFEDIIEEVAGVYPKIMTQGDMEAGAWSCGMVAGLIHDVPTVKELVDRIMAEAEAIIGQRLRQFAAG
jgi:NAD(P)H-dependent flavin oxidoreductase YrpB (nitropropane dioxygenase family)